ncbi:MAG: LuxR C-terminal-related transcriptional regulator [Spirochaetales bacterium]|nr:LuxR C-terminal-related transcriptional regulator [Spirochaetales bacterium]
MYLRDDQSQNIQSLISVLFSSTLDNALVQKLTPLILRITDCHYFAIVLFPGPLIPEPIYITNNPSDFNKLYYEIQDKDFIMHNLIETVQPSLYSVEYRKDISYKHDFVNDLNKLRPVSDCSYYPVLIQDRLSGFIGIARGGKGVSAFSDNELKVIRFVSSILGDAIKQSLRLPDPDLKTAYASRNGEIQNAGEEIREVLIRLFGDKWKQPLWSETMYSRDFTVSWDRLISPLSTPADADFSFSLDDRKLLLEFSYHGSPFQREGADFPFVKISLRDNTLVSEPIRLDAFAFTSREKDVIDCIYRGCTTDDICRELKVARSTVKKHIWNIYNKAGVDNRTSLIFTLSH